MPPYMGDLPVAPTQSFSVPLRLYGYLHHGRGMPRPYEKLVTGTSTEATAEKAPPSTEPVTTFSAASLNVAHIVNGQSRLSRPRVAGALFL